MKATLTSARQALVCIITLALVTAASFLGGGVPVAHANDTWCPPGDRLIGQWCVRGAILQKYDSLGRQGTNLGLPSSPEMRAPDGVGYMQFFHSGSAIYWTQGTGANMVRGKILERYAAMGYETSDLGYPTTDEAATPTRPGAYSHFQGGSIYWQQGDESAWPIWGKIREYWASRDYEKGQFGFPKGNEYNFDYGKAQQFEYGTTTEKRIEWLPTDPPLPSADPLIPGGYPKTSKLYSSDDWRTIILARQPQNQEAEPAFPSHTQDVSPTPSLPDTTSATSDPENLPTTPTLEPSAPEASATQTNDGPLNRAASDPSNSPFFPLVCTLRVANPHASTASGGAHADQIHVQSKLDCINSYPYMTPPNVTGEFYTAIYRQRWYGAERVAQRDTPGGLPKKGVISETQTDAAINCHRNTQWNYIAAAWGGVRHPNGAEYRTSVTSKNVPVVCYASGWK